MAAAVGWHKVGPNLNCCEVVLDKIDAGSKDSL